MVMSMPLHGEMIDEIAGRGSRPHANREHREMVLEAMVGVFPSADPVDVRCPEQPSGGSPARAAPGGIPPPA